MNLLVTGATGHVGGALVGQLAEAGLTARALVRRDAALPAGIEPVRGDLNDPASVVQAVQGVDRVFLVWPMGDPAAARDAVAAMAGCRIVYLSSHGASEDEDRSPILRMHGTLERLIRELAGGWTLLRAGGFAANTLGWADQIREHRTVRWPYGEARRSLVHEADLAAVAFRALTTDGLLGATPHLTGPQVLSQIEQVETIGDVLEDPVTWVELDRDRAREQMLEWGWLDGAVDGALDAWARMVTDPEVVSPDVERLLGSPARPYAQWVRDHVDAFR
ncbi:NAD(P)H-binding protein [Actinoplanes sp. NPDC051513]|uniref:NAD(P)H-binding protein n=1 Tax=Actinoplanes sp. NPDC051513 TaxID=3363908 RepID=UPI0037BD42C3